MAFLACVRIAVGLTVHLLLLAPSLPVAFLLCHITGVAEARAGGFGAIAMGWGT